MSMCIPPRVYVGVIIPGYEDIKETPKLFLESEESINALLTGAPATAKTLFLLSMMRYCKHAYFIDASNATGAGVLDQLFGAKTGTKILLLDEIDKLKRNDQGTVKFA
jgi:putative heme iron utilization protein